MKMLHLAQHFESDGGMNHCNFLLPASNFKIFSQNISLRAHLIKSVHIENNYKQNQKMTAAEPSLF